MDDITLDLDRNRVIYPATLVFDGDELEVAETREGVPYVVFRGVQVDTGYEVVERTVMAFGDAMTIAEPLRTPGAHVRLDVFDSGRVIKIAGENEALAA